MQRVDLREQPGVPSEQSGRDRGMAVAELSLALVTPARNEAAFIESTIRAVVAQTVRPARWIIVSDGSTDGTDDIVKAYAEKHPWIEYLRMPERRERNFGGKAIAFNTAYERLRSLDYDVIGNLDADITIEKDQFALLLQKFRENPQLGVAGAPFRDGTQQYDYRFTSIEHVSGACQLFRRECFEEVGGYTPVPLGGVDLIAVLTARMKGWETRSFPERVCIHHRKMGSAERGSLEIAFKGGMGDYRLGVHPLWQVCRAIYQGTRPPVILGGMLRFAGFFWAMARRKKKVVPVDVEAFRKREQMARLGRWVRNIPVTFGVVSKTRPEMSH
jgi:poly-beta-1,6-N-acetyl-D-glucosamine synthase